MWLLSRLGYDAKRLFMGFLAKRAAFIGLRADSRLLGGGLGSSYVVRGQISKEVYAGSYQTHTTPSVPEVPSYICLVWYPPAYWPILGRATMTP